MTTTPLLSIEKLDVSFRLNTETVHAVKKTSFDLNKGETLVIVGEPGSRRSVTAMSIVGLLPENITEYSKDTKIILDGENLIQKSDNYLRKVRGNRIGFIFQESMTSLNPYMKIGQQLVEEIIEHNSISQVQAERKVIDMLEQAGIKKRKVSDKNVSS